MTTGPTTRRRRRRRALLLAAALAVLLPGGGGAQTPLAPPPQPLPDATLDAPSGGGSLGAGPVTNLPLPRYVSLRSDRINVRRGPGLIYKKDWVFRRAGMPVRVVGEYGDWRQIVDQDNAGGWVYHSLLSGRRTVIVTAETVTLRRRPEPDAPAAAVAEQGVIARLRRCRPDWCEVEIEDARVGGWLAKSEIWGVDPRETWPD